MAEGGVVGLLAAQIALGRTVLAGWCGLADPLVAELIVREGFDTAVLDMQHGDRKSTRLNSSHRH